MSTVEALDIVFFRGGENSIKTSIVESSTLFDAASSAVSTLIMKVQEKTLKNGQFSHVGIIVTHDLVPTVGLDPDKFYILESTYSMSDRARIGVQIRELVQVVTDYYEENIPSNCPRVVIGKLDMNPWVVDPEAARVNVTRVIDRYASARYDFNILTLLSAPIIKLRPLRKKFNIVMCGVYKVFKSKTAESELNAQFCSELVARVLLECEVINNVNPEDVAPVDFLTTGRLGIISTTYPLYPDMIINS